MRYSEGIQGFPEDALRAATFGREVLGYDQHFFLHGNVPHIALVISLADTTTTPSGRFSERFRGEDPEESMDDDQKRVYRALKNWRNEKAKNGKIPAYAIARNVQLVELVKSAPQSMSGIKELSGIGEKFVQEHGAEVLEILKGLKPAAPQDEHAGATADEARSDEDGQEGLQP